MKFKLEIAMKSLSICNIMGKKRSKIISIGEAHEIVGAKYVDIKFNEGGADKYVSFRLTDGWLSEFSRMGQFRIQHEYIYSVANDGYKSTKIANHAAGIDFGVDMEGAQIVRSYLGSTVMGAVNDPDCPITQDERDFFIRKPKVEIGKLTDYTEQFSIPDASHFIKEAMIDGGLLSRAMAMPMVKEPASVSYQMEISKLRKELSQAEDKIRQLDIEIGIVNKTISDVRSALKCPEGSNVIRFAEIVRCLSLGGDHSDQIRRRAAAIEDVIHHKNKGAFSDEVLQKIMTDIVNDEFYDDIPF